MEPQKIKSAELEALADCNYRYGIDPSQIDPLSVEIMRNPDGTPLLDHRDRIIPISKILATKPLKKDLMTRPGPGGKQIAYMSGECVTRTLNEVFGFDGWCLEIKNTNREVRLFLLNSFYSAIVEKKGTFLWLAIFGVVSPDGS